MTTSSSFCSRTPATRQWCPKRSGTNKRPHYNGNALLVTTGLVNKSPFSLSAHDRPAPYLHIYARARVCTICRRVSRQRLTARPTETRPSSRRRRVRADAPWNLYVACTRFVSVIVRSPSRTSRRMRFLRTSARARTAYTIRATYQRPNETFEKKIRYFSPGGDGKRTKMFTYTGGADFMKSTERKSNYSFSFEIRYCYYIFRTEPTIRARNARRIILRTFSPKYDGLKTANGQTNSFDGVRSPSPVQYSLK